MDRQVPIRSFLMQGEINTIQLMNEKGNNSSGSKIKIATKRIESLKMLAEGFIRYANSDTNTTDIDAKNASIQLANMYSIKGVDPQLLLGQCIRQQLMKNSVFALIFNILNNISKNNEQKDNDSDSDISIPDDVNDLTHTSQSSQNINIYNLDDGSQKMSYDSSTLSFQQEMSSLTIKGIQQNYNEQTEHQNEEVMAYLYALSKSTTELSYLCQRMKWMQPDFYQSKSKISDMLFSCQARISMRLKQKMITLQSICLGAISKKQAKRVASLFLLKKIYNRFPMIWLKYKEYRQSHPSVQQTMNGTNKQIFQKAKNQLINQIFKNEQHEHQPINKASEMVNQYLNGLQNFKAEMNLLIGRYKRIQQPQYQRQKQNQLSLWPVRAFLLDGDQRYESQATEPSRKSAEQKCCRQLLYKIYLRALNRWQDFRGYKKQKGLK